MLCLGGLEVILETISNLVVGNFCVTYLCRREPSADNTLQINAYMHLARVSQQADNSCR